MSGCALVTGASSGIGAATAVSLASRDIDVVAAARQPERLLDYPPSEGARDRLHLIAADLTKASEIDRVFSKAEELHGKVSFVVHSVGHRYEPDWYQNATSDALEAAVLALITSPALLLNRALRSMQSSGGKIGLITSGAANKTTPGRALYSASKVAMNRLIESVAAECESASPDVTVLGISPGRVDTPMQRLLIEAAKDAPPVFGLASFLDTSRLVPAQDVGEAIADLLLGPTTGLNGEILRYHVDGWQTVD